MTYKINLVFIFFLFAVFISCKKSSISSFDLNCQQYTDFSGNPLQSTGNCDKYFDTIFTANELSLFNTLDTANLALTSLPDSISFYNYTYPNPSVGNFRTAYFYNSTHSGQVLIKIIITDNNLTPVFSTIKYISYNQIPNGFPSSVSILLSPNLPSGNYRLYQTISTISNLNFKKCWTNIKIQ